MKISKIKIPGVQNPIDIKDTTYQFEQVGDTLKMGVDGGTKSVIYQPTKVEHEYVDLGLPSGNLWATCNIGANAPEEYGLYFSWGNVIGHTGTDGYDFSDETYETTPGYTLTGDIPANATYDAATANWGEDWHMPNKEDFLELYDECTWTWTTKNSINGYEVEGSNGNTIFFPATGYCDGTSQLNVGTRGLFWSASYYNEYSAYLLYFYSGRVGPLDYFDRYNGFTIRPITKNLLEENNKVIAVALADLNEKIESFTDFVSEKELAISAAVNDINNKYARVVPTGPQYEAVDLGLPSGIKWANMNVGATIPADTGLYFTWGSVEGFTKDSGRYCDGSRNGERDWSGPYSKEHGSELGDEQNIPDNEYFDAARKNMGASWRMPTKAEMVELHNSTYTTWTWTQRNGMNGYLVVSRLNSNSIFLPAAGYFTGEFSYLGSDGYYWLSDFSNEESGYNLYFGSSYVDPECDNGRCCGCSVRAVQG